MFFFDNGILNQLNLESFGAFGITIILLLWYISSLRKDLEYYRTQNKELVDQRYEDQKSIIQAITDFREVTKGFNR